MRIRYCCVLLFCFLFPSQVCLGVFCFLEFCVFALFPFAFHFSLILSSISCGFVIVCPLIDSGVVVVLAASWIVAVNVPTAWSTCSGVFNGTLQFILLSIISLKVCHLVVLLHSVSGLL